MAAVTLGWMRLRSWRGEARGLLMSAIAAPLSAPLSGGKNRPDGRALVPRLGKVASFPLWIGMRRHRAGPVSRRCGMLLRADSGEGAGHRGV